MTTTERALLTESVHETLREQTDVNRIKSYLSV